MARCALVASALLLGAATAAAADFVVNSPADVADANHGDGICETVAGNGVCTLRAAIQEANALSGDDTIHLQANVTYLLTSAAADSALDRIIDNVTIVGAGPASTIIDGNSPVLGKRVMQIAECVGGNVCGGPGPNSVNVNISGVTIRNGSAFSGGAVFNSGVLTLTDAVVTENNATGLGGGGLYNDGSGTLTLVHCVVSANNAINPDPTAGLGGGVFNDFRLYVIDSTISGNTAESHGGGIYNREAVTITNSSVSGNTAGGNGGGLLNTNSGPAIIRGSTFDNNTGAQGGAIYSGVALSVINGTISNNFATASGGGLHVAGGTAGLFNATIAQNLANTAQGAAVGGGITQEAGTVNLLNSVVALNEIVKPTIPPITARDDCSGTITSQGNNIVLDVNAAHCTIAGGGVSSVDPLLGPLQDNGGPTRTHALSIGSPAIDAGNGGGCTDNVGAVLTTDQRGFQRPFGTQCDIGAFEVSDTIFVGVFEL